MSNNLVYSENPKIPRNRPFLFIFYIISNIAGLLVALRLDQQSLQIIGLGVWLGTIIGLLIWYVHTKSTKLSITDNDILLERGLLSKERREVAIGKVRTVNVKQTFLNRILGVGEISIFTAGDLPEIVVKGLPDPNKIREIIKRTQNKSE
jgi:uncharacterized membrane protein YdbT with pleckstrin-like domain|tara:strand:- start:279 stop:728 length:450 start_codon:yes stop_codon:yes gene_type:complete